MSERDPLYDRIAITDVIQRYAHGLDRRDWDMVAACFTADAQATYGGTVLEPGVDNIIRHVRGLENIKASTHFFGGSLIDFDGDEADVLTPATVYLTDVDEAGAETVRTRGLRYQDRFVRQGDKWLIRVRLHMVDWMYESPRLPT